MSKNPWIFHVIGWRQKKWLNIADATVGDKIFNYIVIIWPLSRREAVQVPFLFNREMGSLRVAGTL